MIPTISTDQRVAVTDLQTLVTEIFVRCDMLSADAALLTETLIYADLSGIHSHGVLRVPEYVKKLTHGGVDPRGRPQIMRDSGACLVLDGGNSMGQIGAHFAMHTVLERAKSTGIAAAAIRGSNHCGAMAYYASMALPHDMIGIATTNALPTMAPWVGLNACWASTPSPSRFLLLQNCRSSMMRLLAAHPTAKFGSTNKKA